MKELQYNNFDPYANYGNEYANVHFYVDAEPVHDTHGFYNAMRSLLRPLGYEGNEGSSLIKNGKENLRLGLRTVKGCLKKNHIKQVAETLDEEFKVKEVNVYENVYDISDHEYSLYLDTKEEEIKKELFHLAKEKKGGKYVDEIFLIDEIIKKFGIRRSGCLELFPDNEIIKTKVKKYIQDMVAEMYLVAACYEGRLCVRSINLAEQKALGKHKYKK